MKKILLVIDMQNDFITGSLHNPYAQAVIPFQKLYIESFDGDAIIFTRDTHYENYLETPEGKKLPVPHCIKCCNGWEVEESLVEASKKNGIPVIYRDKEVFGDKALQYVVTNSLGGAAPDVIEVFGTCTEICVISNVLLLKAAFPNAEIKVHADYCAGLSEESHNAAIETMKMCQVDIV